MRILSVLRQVIDAEATIRIVNGQVDLAGIKFITDAMDEYGLEQAIRVREQDMAVAGVVALTGRLARNEQTLRNALATVADGAILVKVKQKLLVIATSAVVARFRSRSD